MSALEAERTLARLYTDASFRHAFLRDADQALAPLDLTSAEKTDFAGIDRAGLVMAAASYQHKRARHAAMRRGPGNRLAKLIRAAMRACSRRLGRHLTAGTPPREVPPSLPLEPHRAPSDPDPAP